MTTLWAPANGLEEGLEPSIYPPYQGGALPLGHSSKSSMTDLNGPSWLTKPLCRHLHLWSKWAGKDLNFRMRGYKPRAVTGLGYPPKFVEKELNLRCLVMGQVPCRLAIDEQ